MGSLTIVRCSDGRLLSICTNDKPELTNLENGEVHFRGDVVDVSMRVFLDRCVIDPDVDDFLEHDIVIGFVFDDNGSRHNPTLNYILISAEHPFIDKNIAPAQLVSAWEKLGKWQ